MFLVGDFNAYTGEDPVQAILNDPDNVDDLGFGLVESDDPDDLTYVFTANVPINGANVGFGAAGSLDHVFASPTCSRRQSSTRSWCPSCFSTYGSLCINGRVFRSTVSPAFDAGHISSSTVTSSRT